MVLAKCCRLKLFFQRNFNWNRYIILNVFPLMADFDPLCFFSNTVRPFNNDHIEQGEGQSHIAQESVGERGIEALDEIDDDEEGLLHILDLPQLNSKLPRFVTLTILKLLQSGQETNFGGRYLNEENIDLDEQLSSKDIDKTIFNNTVEWLRENGYVRLATNLHQVHFSQEFFQYLNKILSSPKYQDDDEILQLTSLRISENSGRTARPNFQRKIEIKNLKQSILLNEPALTSDSLGLKTWGSSFVLSEFIVQNKERLLLDPILELGAGTGLVGISIGLLGHKVMLTDLPEILPNLITNVETNKIDGDCAVLDWTNPKSFIDEKGDSKYNTIVIADPIYSSDHPRWVMDMIKLFLNKTRDARVLLQIPIREKFEEERNKLWGLIDEEGLIVKEERTSDGFDDFGAQKFIYKELRWNID